MTKQLLFTRKRSPRRKVHSFVEKYGLLLGYKDSSGNIFENDIMMVRVSKKVCSVMLYDGRDTNLEMEIKKFFYGEKYEQFKN